MSSRCTPSLALALCVALASSAACAKKEKAAGCSGTLSGAVTGSFTCKVASRQRGSGAVQISLTPEKLPDSVTAFMPGEIEIPAPVQKKAYPLAALGKVTTLLTTTSHQTFVVKKGKKDAPQGDLTLAVEKLEPGDDPHGPMRVSGTLKARLVAAPGAEGEVLVEMKF